jgi:hypothetical protein
MERSIAGWITDGYANGFRIVIRLSTIWPSEYSVAQPASIAVARIKASYSW